ncbi:MAG: adenine phosphoribosyltransferase [candidate division NC10 bacterium]|nr:adenine phosphoribosyltransferase [candidate division NC10 bacterium]
MRVEDLKHRIRDIPDFPKPGILFRDITPLLSDGQAFRQAIDYIGGRYLDKHIDVVVGVEARGFIMGAALAYKLQAGNILIRKSGKLPYKTHRTTYALEYGTDSLEIHQDAIKPGQRVLVADDLLATGGTISAAVDLVKQLGGEIVELAFLIELTALKGREKLKEYSVFSLIQY